MRYHFNFIFWHIGWIIIFVLYGFMVMGQQANIDRAIALQRTYPDSCIIILQRALVEAKSKSDTALMAKAQNVIGTTNWFLGRYDSALVHLSRALALRKASKDSIGYATTLNNIGLVYWKKGDFKQAMESYLSSLAISEAKRDTPGLARSIGNVGILYTELGNRKKGLEYYELSLPYVMATGSSYLKANTLNNIGLIYQDEKNHVRALSFLRNSFEVASASNDDFMRAQSLNNLGISLRETGQQKEAMESFNQARLIYQNLGDTCSMSEAIGNMGLLYLRLGDKKKAMELSRDALTMAEPCEELKVQLNAYNALAEVSEMSGNYAEAIRYYKQFLKLKERLSLADLSAQITGLDLQYQFEREQALLKAEQDKELAIAESEIKRQRQARNAFMVIGALVVGLLVLLYVSFRQKNRDNRNLIQLNNEIKHKNDEITDSIRYANYLQQAVLTSRNELCEYLDQMALLYLPKDIVSGDFYWATEVEGQVIVAVADCTGHGVPGAMMSMVGIQGLERAVWGLGLRKPADILNWLDAHINSTFSHSATTVRDGMDMAICTITKAERKLEFAGANRPLLLFNKVDATLVETKPTKRSIGGLASNTGFVSHQMELAIGDRFILTTDGFQDQFGGMEGKKLGSKRLRETLVNTIVTSDSIEVGLAKAFSVWKGTNFQVDDVTVLIGSV